MSVTDRRFEDPDETKTFDHGRADSVMFDGARITRNTYEPGWRWSESVKPLVGTDSCQVHHIGYLLSGRLHVATEDGGEAEIVAGQAYEVQPGHDGWVVGDEVAVTVEFSSQSS
jgi:hypothetical protein